MTKEPMKTSGNRALQRIQNEKRLSGFNLQGTGSGWQSITLCRAKGMT